MFPSLSLYLGVYSQITFGGMPVSAKPSSGGRENYIGCMEAIHYNGDNITNLVRRRKVDTSSFVRAKFACLFLSNEHCRALQCLVEIIQELHRGIVVAGCYAAPRYFWYFCCSQSCLFSNFFYLQKLRLSIY